MEEHVRAMLGFLEKLTLDPDRVTAADVVPLRSAGLTDEAIEDAINVCVLFTMYTRMADTLEFDIPGPEGFAQGAVMLLERGYV